MKADRFHAAQMVGQAYDRHSHFKGRNGREGGVDGFQASPEPSEANCIRS